MAPDPHPGGGERPVLVAVRRDERTARVVLSDGTVLELAAESLPPALPHPGEPVPPALLAELRAAAARKAVAREVFRLLDRRLHGRAELERKLRHRGHDPAAVAAVLDRFAAEGLVDDRRLAEAWCRDTLRDRPVGRRYLAAALRRRGLAAAVVTAAVDAVLPADAEPAVAARALARWRRRQRPQPPQRLRQRALRYLLGRGFAPAAARRALDAFPEEDHEDPGDR